MFGPYFGRRRRCGFVAVAMRLNRWSGIVTQMGVNINDAGRYKFARPINDHHACWNGCFRTTNAANFAGGYEYYTIVDLAAFAIVHGDITNGRGNSRIDFVGRRERRGYLLRWFRDRCGRRCIRTFGVGTRHQGHWKHKISTAPCVRYCHNLTPIFRLSSSSKSFPA